MYIRQKVEKMDKMWVVCNSSFIFLENDLISLLLSLFSEQQPFTFTKHQYEGFC